ncbi:mandelate racemase/muconate lactonizing enzyme family protein [Amycolatopsis jejuensis]|uniref:mandelate racemase/muconate lactonizing enzyme family protein n=1 Tax=Amycolatopsis jejuensis TaxID=330084 RepID=UPI0005269307|nr:enolase C-terminal domain-like protein [Amycolatopsis jejuensis]
MKIAAVEAIPFSIPLRRPSAFAHGTLSRADHVLVRVTTDDGIVGHAEAPARPFTYGESQESIVKAIDSWIAPAVLGTDPFARERVRDSLRWLRYNHTARSAVDLAIWDVLGKALGKSCHQLLGAFTESVPVVHIIFAEVPEAMGEEALRMRDRHGIGIFKIKTGKDPVVDTKAMRTVRSALGDGAEIYVDANKGWTPDEAIRLLPVMQETGITMIEEPTPAFHPLARRWVAGTSPIPVLADESVTRLGEVAREVLDGHAQLVSIKVARTGFTESARIAGLCEGLGTGVVVGSQMDGALGALSALAFAAAYPGTSKRGAELGYHLELADDIAAAPAIEHGRMTVPGVPGIGIEIDEPKLQHYRCDQD